jgi:hydrogenase large subunit
MGKTLTLDPVTRLEGHISIKVERDDQNGRITTAQSSGTLFRGFEILLQGKDPRDAIHITQRVCGVCPTSHAMASALAVEAAAGLNVTNNARIIRNLILGADFVHSHILHFYHLALPSYMQGPDMPPWKPTYDADMRFDAATNQRMVDHYVQTLSIRRQAHEMGAILGGRLPHTNAYEYGGITSTPDATILDRFRSYLEPIIDFIDNVYLADVDLLSRTYSDYYAVGRGYANLFVFGVFDLTSDGTDKLLARGRIANGSKTIQNIDLNAIVEQTAYSWYNDSSAGLNPSHGQTAPYSEKAEAYSWLKAPRYQGVPYETGPLARMWVTGDYQQGISVMDRHVARALETSKIAHAMSDWLGQINLSQPAFTSARLPTSGQGIGLSEAPRGALGHWLTISNTAISAYQILTPTCWNCSPRDNAGIPGPLEKALEGTIVTEPRQPVEVLRVVQSFDPCLACAVH